MGTEEDPREDSTRGTCDPEGRGTCCGVPGVVGDLDVIVSSPRPGLRETPRLRPHSSSPDRTLTPKFPPQSWEVGRDVWYTQEFREREEGILRRLVSRPSLGASPRHPRRLGRQRHSVISRPDPQWSKDPGLSVGSRGTESKGKGDVRGGEGQVQGLSYGEDRNQRGPKRQQ